VQVTATGTNEKCEFKHVLVMFPVFTVLHRHFYL
jgi:hypothetical protein